MPTNPTEQIDAVIEARELLAKATQGPWRAVALLTDGENHHVLAGKFSDQHIKATSDDHNGLVAFADLPANTELIARAPELLKTLADEVEQLRELVVHMHVHSGYRDNGYLQMTTPQKALYDAVWERSVKELDEEENEPA